METTIWIAIGVITAAMVTRGVKISEFRQAWIDLYLEFNLETDQNTKAKKKPELDRLKYDSLHIHSRISLRFKPTDKKGNILLSELLDLLDPSKLTSNNQYSNWRRLSDKAVCRARELLKEEWEATKNPLRKIFNLIKNIYNKASELK